MLGVQNRIQPSRIGGVRPHRHKIFLVMLCYKSFSRTNPASEEQKSSTGLILPHWSKQKLWFQQQKNITPLQSLFQSWRRLLHDFQALGVLSCYSILASLRNSFCGIDVGEGLRLGNCTAFIFTEDCRTVGMSWFSGPTAARKDEPSAVASLTIQITVSLGPVYVLKKAAEYCASWFLSAIFNLVCTSWAMWVCVYSTLLHFYFSLL